MPAIYKTTSELMTYADCPQKHLFGYVMMLSARRPRERLQEGTILHRVLQEYYNTQDPALCLALLKDLLDGYRETFEAFATDKTRPAIELEIRRLRAVIRAYLQYQAPLDYERYSIAANEIEFAFELWPDRFFTGRIDLLLIDRHTGEYVLIDHKYQKNNGGDDRFVKYQGFWYLLGLERDPAFGLRCRKLVYNLIKHPQLKLSRGETWEDLEERIYQDASERMDEYVNRADVPVTDGILSHAQSALKILYERSMDGPEKRYAVATTECAWKCAFKPPCWNPSLSQEEFEKLFYVRQRPHQELSIKREQAA